MLASFLTRGLDAAPLFEGLEVSCDPAAMAHLGACLLYTSYRERRHNNLAVWFYGQLGVLSIDDSPL